MCNNGDWQRSDVATEEQKRILGEMWKRKHESIFVERKEISTLPLTTKYWFFY